MLKADSLAALANIFSRATGRFTDVCTGISELMLKADSLAASANIFSRATGRFGDVRTGILELIFTTDFFANTVRFFPLLVLRRGTLMPFCNNSDQIYHSIPGNSS